jgi:uncharacterized RDD family membrane protein YckC
LKQYHIIFGLFILSQLLLYFVSVSENIVATDEIAVVSIPVILFLGLFLMGQRWARWVVLFVLASMMLITGSMTFEGFSVGYIIIAFIYAALIVLIFKYRLPGKGTSALENEIHEAPQDLPPVQDGFYAGGKVYHYPLLVKRYQSLLIDGLFWLFIMVVTMVIIGESEWRSAVMISLALTASLLYEPLLTVYASTVGQRVIGIQVRKISNPDERLSVTDAYARVIVKLLLGWVSFITINFNRQHRAIHDLAGSSVVVKTPRE